MADNGSKAGDTWPMPKFHFEVDFGPELKSVLFQEVSGLDVENEVIEYRAGNSNVFSVQKMPGLVKYGNATMKRGVFVNDNSFWDWHKQVAMNTIHRSTVIIKLLDEEGKVIMQWTLANAWPTKISATDLTSTGNEIAVDSIEIAHEKITIDNGN